jgi:UDP-N-acetylmuramate--alanine ligase
MSGALAPLHFVGIGGIGMAALAELFHARGHHVSGSDLASSPTFERLRKLGIDARLGHDAQALGSAETVVRSSAIAEDNPELCAARERGLRIMTRGALLAEVLRSRDAIAIAGSHGKTTTSAMTAHLLEAGGLDPLALIGGRVPRPDGDASPVKLGSGALIVAEVDESDGSFLLARPVIAVVNNIDPEHLDHYGTRRALLDAFVQFANAVPALGTCILGIDHEGVTEIRSEITARTITFGFRTDANVRADSVQPIAGGQRVEGQLSDGRRFAFEVPMPGRHNVLNALAAIAVGLERGVDLPVLTAGLASFPGVSRRFERKGGDGRIEVVDDYAHHPAELKAALAGARSIHPGPITAIFQPHRFTRTRDCWDEFVAAFADADRVVLADIYPASEAPIEGIDSARLAQSIAAAGHPDVHYGGGLDAIASDWSERLRDGELVLTLGAGDVVGLGPRILARRQGERGGVA